MFKGFIANKKKGDLLDISEGDIFVVEKPNENTETDPTVPNHVKEITQEDIEGWYKNNYVVEGAYSNSERSITLTLVDGSEVSFPVFFRKTIKTVSSSTYTLTSSDQYRWLLFLNNCTVTIPTGLVTDDLFEGESFSGATVTFQAESGVTLRHVNSISKTLSPNGVFGIRFRNNNSCILYGTDPTNYLNQ